MAFLAGPLRWPDALQPNSIVAPLRSILPYPLSEASAPILLSVLSSACALLLFFLTTVNRYRQLSSPHAVGAARTRPRTTQRRRGDAHTVLLVGPEEAGKTALFSKLLYGITPQTHTSQHENEGNFVLQLPASLQDEKAKHAPIHLVDLPGHPRLRARLNDFLPAADAIVFCVDVASASKAASANTPAASGAGGSAALSEVADQIHATLTAIAKQRLRRGAPSNAAAPALLVLFTRSDLSPMLSAIAGSGSLDSAASEQARKRRAQLLERARSALETEVARRRTGMALGRRAGATIGGMERVTGGGSDGSGGWLSGWLRAMRAMVGLEPSASASTAPDAEEDEEEEHDYLDWATAQRAAQSGSTGVSTASFSFNKLDEDVVRGGSAQFALASVGKPQFWTEAASGTAEDEKAPSDHGLTPLKEWLAGLDE